MRYHIATHKLAWIVAVMGLLLLGLILVVGAKGLGLISSATEAPLLMTMVLEFPFIITLIEEVLNEN